jgi:hypothetical protein
MKTIMDIRSVRDAIHVNHFEDTAVDLILHLQYLTAMHRTRYPTEG